VAEIKIEVPEIGWDTLVARACAHYNAGRFARTGDFFPAEATPRRTTKFLHRIIVNYIRHELTDYEFLISAAGNPDAINDLREVVFDAISDTFPELWRECSRQRRAREIDTVLLEIEAQVEADQQAEAAAAPEALLEENPELAEDELWLFYLDADEVLWLDMLADLRPDGDYSGVPQYILQQAGLLAG
jgi:hypothetical protein